jgi:hypothetical protein
MWSDVGIEPLTSKRVQFFGGHAAVGLATFILCTIYPFISLIRPHPFESKFKIFNILYQVLWYCIISMAFATMGLAADFSSFNLADGKILLYSSVAFYVAFEAILMAYTKYVGQNQLAVYSFLFLYLSGAIVTTVAMISFILQ